MQRLAKQAIIWARPELAAQLADEAILPKGLVEKLYPHQRLGINWLVSRPRGAILSDEMGLGKTLQAIGLLLATLEITDQVLVVLPPSLLGVWEKEIKTWTDWQIGRMESDQIPLTRVVLCTYTRLHMSQKVLKAYPFARIIFDEAQALKNPESARYRAARSLKCPKKLCLTGTPIENSLRDLWALMELVAPSVLQKTPKEFISWSKEVTPRQFNRRLAPYLLGRTKEGVKLGLPQKSEQVILCPLSPSQKALYLAATRPRRLHEIAGKRMHVFALIQELKQLCDHPSILGKEGEAGKMAWLAKEMPQWNDPTIIFTQYRPMQSLLIQKAKELGFEVHELHGSMAARKREKAIQAWHDSKEMRRIFVISLKAGGVGLTLTEAARVVHYDRWWNPAVEDQATDRVHRIGQDREVDVYYLVSPGTLEERIQDILQNKRKLQGILATDPRGLENLVRLTKKNYR